MIRFRLYSFRGTFDDLVAFFFLLLGHVVLSKSANIIVKLHPYLIAYLACLFDDGITSHNLTLQFLRRANYWRLVAGAPAYGFDLVSHSSIRNVFTVLRQQEVHPIDAGYGNVKRILGGFLRDSVGGDEAASEPDPGCSLQAGAILRGRQPA